MEISLGTSSGLAQTNDGLIASGLRQTYGLHFKFHSVQVDLEKALK